MDDLSIKKLITKIKQGDKKAFENLIHTFGCSVMGYLIKMTHKKDQAEDIYQEVWLKLPDKLSQFDMSKNFEPWLITLTRNTAIDYLRKEKKHGQVIDITDIQQDRVSTNRLEDDVINQMTIDTALSQLSQEQRDIILLRYMSDRSYNDIAVRLNIKPSDVKWKLYEAKKQLKKTLDNWEEKTWIAK